LVVADLNVEQMQGEQIAFLEKYMPWSRHKAMGGDGSNYDAFSGRVLDFKGGNAHAITTFESAIRPHLPDNYVLCAVPSHDPAKKVGSLHTLCGKLAGQNGLVDGSSALERHTLIPKLATGGSRSVQVHLDSIRVAYPGLVNGRHVVIIDDVTTTGGSLIACKQLLLAAGAQYVACLAIGRTL
jgi:hypothetical protein